jgi:hypothetical protein
MRRHFLSVLERAAIREVSGDPGGVERMIANGCVDAGGRGAARVMR